MLLPKAPPGFETISNATVMGVSDIAVPVSVTPHCAYAGTAINTSKVITTRTASSLPIDASFSNKMILMEEVHSPERRFHSIVCSGCMSGMDSVSKQTVHLSTLFQSTRQIRDKLRAA
jgi:arginine/lysine/ornithine decarboxylase